MGFGEVRLNKAAWTSTIHDVTSWIARFPNRNCIFKILNLTQHNVFPDYMHTKHLGIDMYFLASVLVLLVFHILPGNKNENLQRVWRKLQEAYRAIGERTKFSRLTLSMFCTKDVASINKKMPVLKGRASEVKHMAKVQHMDNIMQ